MSTITAAEVNKLRSTTGAGMMDCKKALTEAEGDFEKAIDILRKKGQKVAASRSDRDAKEGRVVAFTDGTRGVLVAINCETDFVAKNENFSNFVDTIAKLALDKKPGTIEELGALSFAGNGQTVAEAIIEQVGKIGEKIEISRFEVLVSDQVIAYNHHGNKLATIVGFSKTTSEQVAKDVAMQVAAMAPIALDKSDVPAEVLERELEIARDVIRQEGKPEDMVEKIAQGKVNKFYKESTLLNQEFIMDNKKTVSQYITDSDKELKVTGFKRIALG